MTLKSSDARAAQAGELLEQHHISLIPFVVDGQVRGWLAGVFGDTYLSIEHGIVDGMMSPHAYAATPDAAVQQVVSLLEQANEWTQP